MASIPTTKGPEARAKRSKRLRDFDGLRFLAKIGIEKGKPRDDRPNETYRDRNVIDTVITPDKPEYRGPIEQGPATGGGSPPTPTSSTPVAKPAWAQ